jgi:hypothetical protein
MYALFSAKSAFSALGFSVAAQVKMRRLLLLRRDGPVDDHRGAAEGLDCHPVRRSLRRFTEAKNCYGAP